MGNLTPVEPDNALRFLVVDDSETFRELIQSFIHRHHPEARVDLVGTGEAALRFLAEEPCDVVLLDYSLPDFDGLEVLGEIRKQLLSCAVVMVTGAGDERLAADIFRMGAYDYLVKSSIAPASLRRCLDQVLERRELEEKIRTRSGDLVSASRDLAERSRALDTAYGKLREKKEELRFLSNTLEDAVQKRTEELSNTTAFLNKVLDSTTEHFIVATGRGGEILTFNRGAEALFGCSSGEVVSKSHFRDLFEELREDDEALEELFEKCSENQSLQSELTGRRADGTFFCAQLAFSPLRGDGERSGDRVLGLVIVGTDVTHERQLERENQAYIQQIEMANVDLRRKNEQVLEANRLKSAFLANVSHELRTPLNAVIGYSDLLEEGVYGTLPERQLTAVGGIRSRAQDLLELINDILDLAKIEAGKMELRIEEIRLKPLLEEVLETGRILATDKDLDFNLSCAPEIKTICTDVQKLRQILFNLVNNAVKFTRQGVIALRADLSDSALEVVVSDTGIGIGQADQEGIFDEFRQVDGTSTREFGGTGLGLAISHRFARLLGGDLVLESTVGQGSIFTLRIPLQKEETADLLGTGDHVPVTLEPTPG